MCLATDLLNYAYQSLNTSYRRYCELFEITLLEGQKTINWFGLHLDMPKNIRDYLYSLERKIVIEEIWDD